MKTSRELNRRERPRGRDGTVLLSLKSILVKTLPLNVVSDNVFDNLTP